MCYTLSLTHRHSLLIYFPRMFIYSEISRPQGRESEILSEADYFPQSQFLESCLFATSLGLPAHQDCAVLEAI